MRNKRWTTYGKILGTAILAVLLVRALLVTSCFIPSSGMENSLYKGEGVLVNKWSYGLRLPFPSWIGYHRLATDKAVKGDVVVFNNPLPVKNNQRLETRDLFISRCIGTPGDTLLLNEDLLAVDGEVFSPDSKALFVYPSSSEDFLLETLMSLGLSDNALVGYAAGGKYIRSFSHYEYYLVTQRVGDSIPFTPFNESMARLQRTGEHRSLPDIVAISQTDSTRPTALDSVRHLTNNVVAQGLALGAHPFVIPTKGKSVRVYPWNVKLLCNTLVSHEHRKATVKGDSLMLGGKYVQEVVFSKDYYWMASNDPVNFNDSRLFGFVPEDHLIGKAWLIWYPARKGRFFRRVH